jgi:hypothetical protein
MKKIVFFLIIGMVFISCENDNLSIIDGNRFLVDRIYDYHDILIGEFYYNNKNQLIKASWNTHSDEFVYKNNRVKEIKRTMIADNYIGDTTINLYYDNRGRIIKVGYNGAEPVNTYSYLPNGKLDLPGVEYDKNSNIVRFTQMLKNPDPIEDEPEEFEWIGEYEYDEKLKPNFGIGDVFVYSPLFNYNDDVRIINNLSHNNVTKFTNNGRVTDTYIYTYNEYGLPVSIETKWEGIETTEPMIWKLQYKEISE